MFDDVFGVAAQYNESFRGSVHDSFGMSIVEDVLNPILKEIDSLRLLSEELQRQTVDINQVLEEARSINFNEGGE